MPSDEVSQKLDAVHSMTEQIKDVMKDKTEIPEMRRYIYENHRMFQYSRNYDPEDALSSALNVVVEMHKMQTQ